MRKTPTKVVEKGNNDNLVSSVKTAATILIAALGITVATSQDANAQMFSRESAKKEIAEKKAEGRKLDNESAKLDNTIVVEKKKQKVGLDERKILDAKIARLEGKKGE